MSKYIKCHPSFSEDSLICEAVRAAEQFDGLTEANRYFASLCSREPKFVKLSNNVYHYKDYYINAGKRFLMAGHGQSLMGLTGRMELSCLPQGIAVIWLNNGQDMVLVTRVAGSEAHRLLPYTEPVSALPVQTRQRLLADVDRMLEQGCTLRAVQDPQNTWHILEGEDRIIFSRCVLVTVPEEAKAIYRSRVLEALWLEES